MARIETVIGRSTAKRLYIWGEPPVCCDGQIFDAPAPLYPSGPWLDFAIGPQAFAIHAADSMVWFWSGRDFAAFGREFRGVLRGKLVPAPADTDAR